MPAPVSWPGTPIAPNLWASFPGGVGAPHVPIPLNGGARRSRRSKSRHHRKSKKSIRRRRHTRRK